MKPMRKDDVRLHRLSAKGLTVWILTYSHKHGDDKYALHSEQAAKKYAVGLIKFWLADVNDETDRREIEAALKKGDDNRVLLVWRGYQQERPSPESLGWEKVRVL